MKHLYLLFILISLNSFAQDARQQARQYEERQAANKRSEEHIHQQYLNNLPNDPGTKSTGTGQTWIEKQRQSEKEVQQWLDSRKPERGGIPEKTREQLRAEIERDKDIAITREYLLKNYTPVVANLIKEGFKEYEGYHMVERTRDQKLPAGEYERNVKEVELARYAKSQFDKLFATAGFETLMQHALNFKVAGLTSITALRSLKTRFPAKADELDMAMVQVVPSLFSAKPIRYMHYLDQQNPSADEAKQAMDAFTYLMVKYPVETCRAATLCKDSPYERGDFINWLFDEATLKQKAGIFLFVLQAEDYRKPLPRTVDFYHRGYLEYLKMLDPAVRFFLYGPNRKYIKDLKAQDWIKISKAKGIPTSDLLIYMSDHRKPIATRDNYDYRTGDGFLEFSKFKERKFDELLFDLAKLGDGDAMNAIAVRYAVKLIKKDPGKEVANWLFKAADAGSFMGAMNLYYARFWYVKEYMTDENLAIADQKAERFFEKATGKDNYEGALMICNGRWKDILASNGQQSMLARTLVNRAAANGYAPAAKVLADFPALKL